MDPISLVPSPEAIPVNWVWLQIFLVLTTFLHLVAMNIMLGSGVIALSGPLTGGDDNIPMSRSLARTIPYSLAFTINFGVAPLLFLQTLYGQFFYTSTVLMAVFWLSIPFLIIISYYLLYIYNYQFENIGHQSALLGIPSAAFLLIAFLFVNNISLMETPESWIGYFSDQSGLLLNLSDPAILPRYLHFIFSAIAIGGLSLAIFSDLDKSLDSIEKTRRIHFGLNWFTIATIINFGTGFWFLGTLPEKVIINADPSGTWFFVMIIAAIVATSFALIYAMSRRIYKATGWTVATIFLMVIAREITRSSYLREFINVSELKVNPEYGPFMVFLAVLAFSIWLISWMLKKVCSEMGGER